MFNKAPSLCAGRYIKVTVITGIVAIVAAGCGQKGNNTDLAGPEAALSTFELPAEFKIELLAAEPLLGDPVDMEIDEFGRLYVVEMPGYPLDKSGSGTIRLLSDQDGDGRMDSSTVFADQLILPNSVMRWKNGILVTDAPYVLYFEDRDGDGRSDVRDTLLTGFALSNPQHNLNSPLPGIDNWIYLSHEGSVSTETYKVEFGDRGSEIHFPKHPKAPRLGVNANGRSVRFYPDKLLLEETSAHSQFGHTFDEWGHYFLVGNSNHIYQEMIAAPYLRKNKQLLISATTESLSDHGDAAEVFPISENPQHQLLTDIGVMTSACGLVSYLGGAFPSPYNENTTFVAEPVGNLVHVDKLRPSGTSFVASRILEQEEFLASRDQKFRPVNLYVGPDGALYVVDYYRQIIEHPEWMDEEVVRSGVLYNDNDKGRIYRITAKAAPRADWTKGLDLGNAPTEKLIEKLSDGNGWWRMNAQRLLVDRRDHDAIQSLQELATNGKSSLGRLHALWTLQGMDVLKADVIARALRDTDPGVRENAVKLAELHLPGEPVLTSALLKLANDANARVRYQVLCTLGDMETADARDARKQILFRDIDDRWVQVAALPASADAAGQLLTEVLSKSTEEPRKYLSLIERLSGVVVTGGNRQACRQLVGEATRSSGSFPQTAQAAVLNGMATGLNQTSGTTHNTPFSLADMHALADVVLTHPSPEVTQATLRLLNACRYRQLPATTENKALALLSDKQQSDVRRAHALSLLGLSAVSKHQALFLEQLTPQEPLSVQLAALRSLSLLPPPGVSQMLVDRWPSLTPDLHDAAVASFLDDSVRIAILLDAIAAGKIPADNVRWPRRVRLMAQHNIALRDRARALFAQTEDPNIRKTMNDILRLDGDASKGQLVYEQHCGLCHQLRGKLGQNLGPDLGTVHNWSPEAILSNIVDPNKSISSGYDLCSIELTTGEAVQGIIASESPGAITLRNNGSADKIINRKDIKSLTAMNMSIMPVDLATQISNQQMADLLSFLKKNK